MKRILFISVILSAILSACSDSKDAVTIVEKSFDEEVPLAGNMTFTFSKDLVQEQNLNCWDTIEYIRFEPEIKGRYMWTSPNTMVFSPVRQLAPSTEYTGTITDLLVKGTELKLGDEKTFRFHTPYLRLEGVTGYWAAPGENGADARIHFCLKFNYLVKPSEVAGHLAVSLDGTSQDFTLAAEETAQSVVIFLPGIAPEDKTYQATLTIEKGLTAAHGTSGIREKTENEVTVTSPYKLTIQDAVTDHDGMTGKITVYTSQRVDEASLKKFISIEPDVAWNVEVHDQELVIKSEEFDVTEKYRLSIEKGLKGFFGGELKYEFTQEMSFGKLQPSIKFLDKKNIYLSGKGSRDIEVSIVNVPRVKLRILKVYENNILSFLGSQSYYYGDYYYNDYGYDDYGYDDYYYDDYYYYDNTYSRAGNLGDVVYEQEYLTKELERSGNRRVLKLDFPDKLSNYNGLYVVQVYSDEEYWLSASKTIAISDIGLIVKEGKSSITVFANSVSEATPLSDVEISFIGQNNQATGTVKTDNNGVAVFDQGTLPAPGFRVKLITASLGTDFNYLLFNQTRVNTGKYDVGGKREQAAGYDAFIYGDRDLYRPGESIHITAVLRDFEW
ncbi:MAG: hypothetical protein KJ607_04115, partial [Bacteroidetes bacterium]|nr:hypothetical protein [Bacteroidota bacterium]